MEKVVSAARNKSVAGYAAGEKKAKIATILFLFCFLNLVYDLIILGNAALVHRND